MKKNILWLFATNLGRYVLASILLISGVFSQYGTIEFLSTDWVIFEITPMIGVVLMVSQFIYHVISAIAINIKNS